MKMTRSAFAASVTIMAIMLTGAGCGSREIHTTPVQMNPASESPMAYSLKDDGDNFSIRFPAPAQKSVDPNLHEPEHRITYSAEGQDGLYAMDVISLDDPKTPDVLTKGAAGFQAFLMSFVYRDGTRLDSTELIQVQGSPALQFKFVNTSGEGGTTGFITGRDENLYVVYIGTTNTPTPEGKNFFSSFAFLK